MSETLALNPNTADAISQQALMHPMWSPIAVKLGPVAIHWYGLMYLLGFILFLILGRKLIQKPAYRHQNWSPLDLDDILFYGVIGVILGGRIGYIVFYKLEQYIANPLDMFKIWQGGMSFHGGLIGVIIALAIVAKVKNRSFWTVADLVAPLVPPGLMTGRFGNFINGELWGRPVETPLQWAMIFPQSGDMIPRHPSQIYQSLGEGLALFVLLWLFMSKPRPTGAAAGFFLTGYGLFRFAAEFFREPDRYLPIQALGWSRGQWLCVPMIVAGLLILFLAYKNRLTQTN